MAIKVFLFGLDQAGKTFITNYLIVSMSVGAKAYNPTLGFNVKNFSIKNLQFQIWDAPGQTKLRETWKKGYSNAELLIFVLDVADKERFKEARDALQMVLENFKAKHVPLIFCNHKMDIKEAKENLPHAQKFFSSTLENKKAVELETSIHISDSMEQLKNQFVLKARHVRDSALH